MDGSKKSNNTTLALMRRKVAFFLNTRFLYKLLKLKRRKNNQNQTKISIRPLK